MVTIDHECYVDMEVAKLLKKAGFDWKCKYAYIITPAGDMPTGEEGTMTESEIDTNWLAQSPTLDGAQKWMREEKGVEVNVICVYINHIKKYSYTAFTNEYEHEIIDEGFGTYEEAQDAGIKNALETILQIANAK